MGVLWFCGYVMKCNSVVLLVRRAVFETIIGWPEVLRALTCRGQERPIYPSATIPFLSLNAARSESRETAVSHRMANFIIKPFGRRSPFEYETCGSICIGTKCLFITQAKQASTTRLHAQLPLWLKHPSLHPYVLASCRGRIQ